MEKEANKLSELEMIPGETQEEYVERTLWTKIKQTAARVPFVPDVVAMYYTVRDAKTPFWARATVFAALAYFILPVDTIPDFIPLVGFSDDAGAIAAALAAVSAHMTDEHREKARQALESNRSRRTDKEPGE
ncbi:MAG: YkvA family protein [Syntrophomonadaceae bacterium]